MGNQKFLTAGPGGLLLMQDYRREEVVALGAATILTPAAPRGSAKVRLEPWNPAKTLAWNAPETWRKKLGVLGAESCSWAHLDAALCTADVTAEDTRKLIFGEGLRSATTTCGEKKMEAAPGFEPGMTVLQTVALPLGYAASEEDVRL